MKFIREIGFDIKQGVLKSKVLFIYPIVLATVMFADFKGQVFRGIRLDMIGNGEVSYMDYWLYVYGGMREYVPSPGNPFTFPVVWILLFLSISFFVLNYPFEDMLHFGQQTLIRSKGRVAWWFSKCWWNVSSTVLYHGLILMVGVIACALFRIPIENQVHLDFIRWMFGLNTEGEALARCAIPVSLMILPILISIGFNLLQMTVSLFMKPMFSFFVTAVSLIASAYLLAPWMIGNYAMPIRYNWILEQGVSISLGYLASGILIVASIVVGLVRFRHYDILNKG